MKKFVKLVKWTVYQFALCTLIYLAVIEKVAGAGNLLVTLVTLLTGLAIIALIPAVIVAGVKDKDAPIEPAVSPQINIMIDVCFSSFLIWHSWWYTGVAFLFASLLLAAVLSIMNQRIQENLLAALSKDYS